MRVEVTPEVKHRAVSAEWIARGCGTVWFFYLPPLDGDFDRQAMERAGKAGRELAYVDRGFYAAKLVGIGR